MTLLRVLHAEVLKMKRTIALKMVVLAPAAIVLPRGAATAPVDRGPVRDLLLDRPRSIQAMRRRRAGQPQRRTRPPW